MKKTLNKIRRSLFNLLFADLVDAKVDRLIVKVVSIVAEERSEIMDEIQKRVTAALTETHNTVIDEAKDLIEEAIKKRADINYSDLADHIDYSLVSDHVSESDVARYLDEDTLGKSIVEGMNELDITVSFS